jgi:ankyrin repeat protein
MGFLPSVLSFSHLPNRPMRIPIPHHRKTVFALKCLLACHGLFLVGCKDAKEQAQEHLQQMGVAQNLESYIVAAGEGNATVADLLDQAGIHPSGVGQHGKTPLQVALEAKSNLAMPLVAKTQKELINHRDPQGKTAFFQAMALGLTTTALQLLERGADPDLTPENEPRPLLKIIERREERFAQEIIRRLPHGAPALHSALCRAAELNLPDLAQTLLEQGASPDLFLPSGATLLYDAYVSRKQRLFDLLIKHRAKFPEPGCNGMKNLLILASAAGDLPAVEAFLAAGATLSDSRPAGVSVRDLAPDLTHKPLLAKLLKTGLEAKSLVPRALDTGDIELLEMCFSHGYSPEERFAGDQALHLAAKSGKAKLVAYLLEKGAPLDTVGADEQSAFALALAVGSRESIQAFLAKGADPNAVFAGQGTEEFHRLLKNEYFSRWLKKDKGLTPLMLAGARGDTGLVEMLMAAGAKRSQNTQGWKRYPINFACETEHIAAAQLLLGRKPDSARDMKIIISLSNQRATVYKGDKAIRSTSISSGRSGFSTPKGRFVISDKQSHWMSTIYHCPMPYFMRLSCRDFGLHQGVVTGRPASHGCIRLPSGTARDFFSLMQIGDPVIVQN